MGRKVALGLSILAVTGGMGWKLAGRRDASARLQDVTLVGSSEHSRVGAPIALAGIRIRISTNGYEINATPNEVPAIPIAGK